MVISFENQLEILWKFENKMLGLVAFMVDLRDEEEDDIFGVYKADYSLLKPCKYLFHCCSNVIGQ